MTHGLAHFENFENRRTRVARSALPLAFGLAWLVAGAANTASAQTPPKPTTFNYAAKPVQKVGNIFKFQAKISQGKLPVGDALFPSVIINLKDSTGSTLCSETLSNVKATDGVLNLRIGAGFTCVLDDVIAANSDLSFQVCIGNTQNCLAPIALSTVPYATKATFATQAQSAYQADIAAQSNFAHYMAADQSLLVSTTIGTGYYDFHTPTTAPPLVGLAVNARVPSSGFIQWAPVPNQGVNTLNICSKNSSDVLVPLASLLLHSTAVRVVSGSLTVDANETVGGALSVTGNANVTGALTVGGGSTLGGLTTATGALQVTGNAVLNGGTQIYGNSSYGTNGSSTPATFTFYDNVVFSRPPTGLGQASGVANDAVGSAQIIDSSITSADILDGTVTSADIANSTIVGADIASSAITSAHIATDTIVAADVAAAAIGTSELADGSVTSPKVSFTGTMVTYAYANTSMCTAAAYTATVTKKFCAITSVYPNICTVAQAGSSAKCELIPQSNGTWTFNVYRTGCYITCF